MSQPSLARNFFEGIVNATDPITAIRRLIECDPTKITAETDWLEFKTEHMDQKQRDKKIREQWSEALGGFANNQGGVLIWGIIAKKTKIGGVEIEAACGERPMTDPLALRSRLVELQRGATDPPLANVEVEAYEAQDKPGTGFVVCYVPEGPFKPYRSEQNGSNYYLRAADNFVIMSRSVLATMFYPRSKPYLWVSVLVKWEIVPESRAEFMASVTIHNDGQASAKDVMLLVYVEPIESLSYHATASKQWSSSVSEDWAAFHSSVSIHPGTLIEACRIKWETELIEGSELRPSFRDISLSFRIAAENMEAVSCEISLTPDDIAKGWNLFEAVP